MQKETESWTNGIEMQSFLDEEKGLYIVEYISGQECVDAETRLVKNIQQDYKSDPPVCIIVANGAIVYGANVFSQLNMPHAQLEIVQTSSYGDKTLSDKVHIVKGISAIPAERRANKNLLLIDDIYDTGKSLRALLEEVASFPDDEKPNSLEICCLLAKPTRAEEEIDVRYLGISIPDVFVVGWGLDYKNYYRGLKYIGAVNFTDQIPTQEPSPHGSKKIRRSRLRTPKAA